MSRFAALLLCTLVATVATAFPPTPLPRSGPWVAGWDSQGSHTGSRFDRSGDKLTITLRGKTGAAHAKLLRDVEGDFAVEVRVELTPNPRDDRAEAGLWLTDSQQHVYLARITRRAGDKQAEGVYLHTAQARQAGDAPLCTWKTLPGPPAGKPDYLRLERHGDRVLVKFRAGGKDWNEPEAEKEFKLQHKLKVGVLAQAAGTAEFKATFDDFKLTPLGGKTR